MTTAQPRNAMAAELAGECLGYLAEHPDDLAAFMAYAGYSPDGLRGALDTPGLAHGLIDYMAQNESLLLAFCAHTDMRPEAFMRVWQQLNPHG